MVKHRRSEAAQEMNLNLNGLLVIRQIDNISPEVVGGGRGEGSPGGKLVPGSHKRCELRHTVIRHFSMTSQCLGEN